MTATEFLLRPEVERRHQRQSAVITGVIIALLILLMLFWVLSKPDPKFPPEGILISMGTTESGFGPVEPSQQEEAATPPPMPDHSPDVVEDVVVTQDVNTVAVTEKERKQESQAKEQVKETVKEPVQPKEAPKVNYEYKAPTANSTKPSTGSGSDNIPGVSGSPLGGDTKNPTGGISGSDGSPFGISGFGGRTPTNQPTINLPSLQESGKAIFNVCIDSEGKVIPNSISRVASTESTVTNIDQINAARAAILELRFTRSPNNALRECGQVSVEFKFRSN